MRFLLLSILVCFFTVEIASAQHRPSPRPLSESSRTGQMPIFHPSESDPKISDAPVVMRQGGKEMADQIIVRSTEIVAPKDGANMTIHRAENGTIRWMSGKLTPQAANKTMSAQAMAAATLTQFKIELKLQNPSAELAFVQQNVDEQGSTHLRFQQTFRGVPVWASEVLVHQNKQGEIYAINGAYQPTPSAWTQTSPSINAQSALEYVVTDLKNAKKWNPPSEETAALAGIKPSEMQLVLYPEPAGAPSQTAYRIAPIRLAFAVTVQPNLVEKYLYFIDAQTGRILHKIAQNCSLIPHGKVLGKVEMGQNQGNSSFSPLSASESEDASSLPNSFSDSFRGSFSSVTALDLNGKTQTIRVYRHDDGNYYPLWDFTNLGTFTLPNVTKGGGLTMSAGNTDMAKLSLPSTATNSWTDRSIVSAHVNMKTVFDYYQTTFGRNGIDDKGTTMRSAVHVTDQGKSMDNAYWNGSMMAYGDGGSYFKALAGSLDVAGHEITHGIVQYTADLVYEGQAGALNESFADVFGYMIDSEDFLIGEDVMQPNRGIALRDLEHPDNSALPSPQPASMSQYKNTPLTQAGDYGGVHINSGITNRAAALIIKAITKVKAEKIYYKALTTYLTRSSQFVDARLALEQSAKDLYGDGSNEMKQVQIAFAAVGIGTTSSSGGTGGTGTTSGTGGAGNDVKPVTNGTPMIAFTLSTGQIGTYNVATNTVNMLKDAFARVSDNGNDRAQLSVAKTGKKIYYINATGKLERAVIDTGAIETFNTLKLFQDGDLWNASISPDEHYVSLVSGYENDATLYLSDGQTASEIPLKLSTSQQGITSSTIQYPDVVSWSPNTKLPRLSFDAFHKLSAGTDDITYWGMYELNLQNNAIYDLIAPAPEEYSMGNIAYANTNPDVVAFNLIDQDGIYYTYIVDFDANNDLYIPFSSSVEDAERPSFSPDDKKVVTVSPANKALIIYDRTAKTLQTLTYTQALYTPIWFVNNGTVIANEETALPESRILAQNFPNPFSSTSEIQVTLPQSSIVTLKIFDMLGREVKTVHTGALSAGAHSFTISAADLPNGVYAYQIETGNSHQTRMMTVIK